MMKRLAFVILFLSQVAYSTPESTLPNLKKAAAEFSKQKTIGALLKSFAGKLEPSSYKFLQEKLKGQEGAPVNLRDVTETSFVVKSENVMVTVELPNLAQGRLQPMRVNHRLVLSETEPALELSKLYPKILEALPEFYSAYTDFFIPRAEASAKPAVVMASTISLFLRFLAGTCFETDITKKLIVCNFFGEEMSSVDGRQATYTRIDEATLIKQAEIVRDADTLNKCADASNIEALRAAMAKLGQCYQKLIDENKINLPAELRPALGLSAPAAANNGAAPSDISK